MKSRRNNDERRGKRAFVAPTDFGSHSMLHQTLLCSSSSSPFSPSPLLFNTFSSPSHSAASPLPLCVPLPPPSLSLAFNYSSQVEKETRMEALRASLRPESLQQQQQNSNQGEEMVWGVERGNLLGGEGFSVDDLLNLGEFADNEWEAEETESEEEGNQQPEKVVEEETVAAAPIETKENPDTNLNSNSSSPSSSYSALSFEPPQLPLVAEISLPAHDASDLEWVSYIIDDSLSEFPMCSGVPPLPPAAQALKRADPPCQKCQDHVPAAKEASFLNPTVGSLSLKAPVHVKAKRSKRARTSAVLWPMSVPRNHFADASSSSTTTSSASSCSSASSAVSSCLIYDNHAAAGEQSVLLYGSHPPRRPPPPSKKHKPKKRGRKPKQPPSAAMNANGERRCSHCGVQKTPQWRTGPLGAKTLCNACGVRFKSGRLLPEYRPACSPTFISTIHSNSHRKVLEMRRKKETEIVAAAAPPVASF